MPPGRAPKVVASAGAMTMANSSGVITGMTSSRGVRTLSDSRLAASVRVAVPRAGGLARVGRRWSVGAVVEMAVMGSPIESCRGVHAASVRPVSCRKTSSRVGARVAIAFVVRPVSPIAATTSRAGRSRQGDVDGVADHEGRGIRDAQLSQPW